MQEENSNSLTIGKPTIWLQALNCCAVEDMPQLNKSFLYLSCTIAVRTWYLVHWRQSKTPRLLRLPFELQVWVCVKLLNHVFFPGVKWTSHRSTLARNEVSSYRVSNEPARAFHGQLVPLRLALQTLNKSGKAILPSSLHLYREVHWSCLLILDKTSVEMSSFCFLVRAR